MGSNFCHKVQSHKWETDADMPDTFSRPAPTIPGRHASWQSLLKNDMAAKILTTVVVTSSSSSKFLISKRLIQVQVFYFTIKRHPAVENVQCFILVKMISIQKGIVTNALAKNYYGQENKLNVWDKIISCGWLHILITQQVLAYSFINISAATQKHIPALHSTQPLSGIQVRKPHIAEYLFGQKTQIHITRQNVLFKTYKNMCGLPKLLFSILCFSDISVFLNNISTKQYMYVDEKALCHT